MRFLAFFALVALAEMATFFWVESKIGLLWALGIAIATAIIGSVLVRRAGISVLGRIRAKWSQGVLPGRELTDGAAILVAGAFLISPGFITDTVGFLLLVPALRAMIHGAITRRFSSRLSVLTDRPRRQRPDRTSPGRWGGDDIIDVDDLE